MIHATEEYFATRRVGFVARAIFTDIGGSPKDCTMTRNVSENSVGEMGLGYEITFSDGQAYSYLDAHTSVSVLNNNLCYRIVEVLCSGESTASARVGAVDKSADDAEALISKGFYVTVTFIDNLVLIFFSIHCFLVRPLVQTVTPSNVK